MKKVIKKGTPAADLTLLTANRKVLQGSAAAPTQRISAKRQTVHSAGMRDTTEAFLAATAALSTSPREAWLRSRIFPGPVEGIPDLILRYGPERLAKLTAHLNDSEVEALLSHPVVAERLAELARNARSYLAGGAANALLVRACAGHIDTPPQNVDAWQFWVRERIQYFTDELRPFGYSLSMEQTRGVEPSPLRLFPALNALCPPPVRIANASLFQRKSRKPDETLWVACTPEMVHLTFSGLAPSDWRHDGLLKTIEWAILREERLGEVDRIAQRRTAEELGIFKQPMYMDLRNHPDGREWVTQLTHIRFSEFPVQKVLASLGAPHRFTFEDREQGFSVQTGGGKISIESDHPLVQALAERSFDVEPEQHLRRFLHALEESEFSLKKLSFDGDNEVASRFVAALAQQIREAPGAYYLKGTRTAGGSKVVKITSHPEANITFASDSPDLHPNLLRMTTDDETFVSEGPEEVIGDLMAHINAPILEARIDTERVNGRVAEFRLICQEPAPNAPLEVTAHYAKVSTNETAANVGLGGSGEPTLECLERIYAKRAPGDDANARAQQALSHLLADTTRFARGYLEIDRSRSRVTSMHPDFAVDICPVWNQASQEIDFHFLELQRGYAFSGLWEADPAGAERVTERKVRADSASQVLQWLNFSEGSSGS